MVHSDIKPENILLHGGEALVAEFGIALAVTAAGGSRLTEISAERLLISAIEITQRNNVKGSEASAFPRESEVP